MDSHPQLLSTPRRAVRRVSLLAMAALALAACGSNDDAAVSPTTQAAPAGAVEDASVTTDGETAATEPPVATDEPAATDGPPATDAPAAEPLRLRIGAIPDQDPEKLARLHGGIAEYLASELGAEVEYVPVTDYAAAVTLFSTGDLDLVWFGGLTGVQARLQTPGAEVLAQRDIDEAFQSVFIANVDAGIEPITNVAGLSAFADRRFTFGSESSTSGRLMPQYFLDQAGIGPDSFSGAPGFSGSHDATVDVVQAGSFEGGALNLQVWERRLTEGTVDTAKVVEIFRTPTYHDYHWILQPSVVERYGEGVSADIQTALTSLSADVPAEAAILELFGAGAFVPADAGDYGEIEEIGRKLGLITS